MKMDTRIIRDKVDVGKLSNGNFNCFLCNNKLTDCRAVDVIDHYKECHSKDGENALVLAPLDNPRTDKL